MAVATIQQQRRAVDVWVYQVPTPAARGHVAIDFAHYHVECSPFGFGFLKFSCDGGDGTAHLVTLRGGKVVGCSCNDQKYRRRPEGCKHIIAARNLVEAF